MGNKGGKQSGIFGEERKGKCSLFSLVPVVGHLVLGIINLLEWVNGGGEVLQQAAREERHLVHGDVVRTIRVDNCGNDVGNK